MGMIPFRKQPLPAEQKTVREKQMMRPNFPLFSQTLSNVG